MKHTAGPMSLTRGLARAVGGSPALFARKVDLESEEGILFVERWDQWMSAKLVDSQRAEGQPPIAADLLEADGVTLVRRTLPPDVADGEATARVRTHPIHYGHEDVMIQQFEPRMPPTAATAMAAPPKPSQPTRVGTQQQQARQRRRWRAVRGGATRGGRRLKGLVFEDGSTCECTPQCVHANTCCYDWPAACEFEEKLE